MLRLRAYQPRQAVHQAQVLAHLEALRTYKRRVNYGWFRLGIDIRFWQQLLLCNPANGLNDSIKQSANGISLIEWRQTRATRGAPPGMGYMGSRKVHQGVNQWLLLSLGFGVR